MMRRVILLALVAFGAAGDYPVVELATPGISFDDLPYASWLQKGSNDIDVSIELATLLAKNENGSVLMRVNAPVYRNQATGDIAPFGPLLSLKRGGEYKVKLTNNLVKQPPGSNATQDNIGITNFHVHGIHESPGNVDRATASEYIGGDNIFIALESKNIESDAGESITLFGTLPEDHLPGNHWYHAHHHLGTSIQTFAAHGGIIVEDDDSWLPDSAGCEPVRTVLNNADRKVMLFTCYPFFLDPTVGANISDTWDVANYQLIAEQGNATYCCDSTKENAVNALYGSGTTDDLVFLNGGFQPSLNLKRGVWQRWSMTLASYKNSLLMQVIDPKTGKATDACDIMLVSKDGVFPMEIPRTVSYMYIPSGGRAEVLVRCDAPVGSKFDLVSTPNDTPVGIGLNNNGNIPVQKLVSITVEEGTADQELKSQACTPLRPAYAADLRDAALAPLNVKPKLDPIPTFTGNPPGIGCSMSGEAFDFNQTPYDLPIGSVVEWRFERLAAHPLHTHINPFQIQRIAPSLLKPNTSLNGGWFQDGDFHDTLLIPMVLGANATNPNLVPLRLQPGPYSGFTVTHCHFLMHEDAGCMHMMEYSCPPGAQVSSEMPFICSEPMPVPGTFTKGSEVPSPLSAPGTPPSQAISGLSMVSMSTGLFLTLYVFIVG